jgi:hypothetical protein
MPGTMPGRPEPNVHDALLQAAVAEVSRLQAENKALAGEATQHCALQRLEAVRYQQLVQELEASTSDNRQLSMQINKLHEQLQAAGITPEPPAHPRPLKRPAAASTAAVRASLSAPLAAAAVQRLDRGSPRDESAATLGQSPPSPDSLQLPITLLSSSGTPSAKSSPTSSPALRRLSSQQPGSGSKATAWGQMRTADSLLRPAAVAAAERVHKRVLGSRQSTGSQSAGMAHLRLQQQQTRHRGPPDSRAASASPRPPPAPRSRRNLFTLLEQQQVQQQQRLSSSASKLESLHSSGAAADRWSTPFIQLVRLSSHSTSGSDADAPTDHQAAAQAQAPLHSAPIPRADSSKLPLHVGVSGGLTVRQIAARLAKETNTTGYGSGSSSRLPRPPRPSQGSAARAAALFERHPDWQAGSSSGLAIRSAPVAVLRARFDASGEQSTASSGAVAVAAGSIGLEEHSQGEQSAAAAAAPESGRAAQGKENDGGAAGSSLPLVLDDAWMVRGRGQQASGM